MAVDNLHYKFNPASQAGARLRDGLNGLERSRDQLVREVNTMNAMLTGNGTSNTHYVKVVDAYGYADTDYAMAGRNELLAAIGKIDALGDSGNTTGVNAAAALDQLFTRSR